MNIKNIVVYLHTWFKEVGQWKLMHALASPYCNYRDIGKLLNTVLKTVIFLLIKKDWPLAKGSINILCCYIKYIPHAFL